MYQDFVRFFFGDNGKDGSEFEKIAAGREIGLFF